MLTMSSTTFAAPPDLVLPTSLISPSLGLWENDGSLKFSCGYPGTKVPSLTLNAGCPVAMMVSRVWQRYERQSCRKRKSLL